MVIKIDVDAVIRNNNPILINMYNKKFPKSKISEIKYYDVSKSFPELGEKAMDYFFVKNNERVFYDAPIFENAKKAIDLLREHGHYVIIVTAQLNTKNSILTLKWLDKYDVKYDSIMVTDKKYLVYGDVLIDDNPKHLESECDDVKTKLFCVECDYNKNYDFKNNVTMVSSLYDAVLKIIG